MLGSIGSAVRGKLLGVIFIGVVIGLLALSILIYEKAFTPVVKVTLKSENVGNQLIPPADVKLRGIFVGHVTSIHSNGKVATLDLALDPSKIDLIPQNVVARILPKTLFGEKFVDLVIPDNPSPRHLAAGDVIGLDRSSTAIELSQVFDNLLPLLQTVQPAKLDMTLSAIASALSGRGQLLGQSLVLSDKYFQGFNPNLPTFNADISGLADLADSLNAAAPDLLRLAANSAFSAQTLVDKQSALAQFLADTKGFADTARTVLVENQNRLIQIADVSRPVLETLATYSNVFPCLLRGLAEQEPTIEQTFSHKPSLHLTITIVPSQGTYVPGVDTPTYSNYAHPYVDKNGNPVAPDPSNPKAICAGLPYPGQTASAQASDTAAPTVFSAGDIGPVGSADEKVLVNTVTGAALGVPPTEVSPMADLLMGPLLRGTQVGLS